MQTKEELKLILDNHTLSTGERANLEKAYLKVATSCFEEACLRVATSSLKKADLRGATSCLEKADLRGANLTGAALYRADLTLAKGVTKT